MSTIAEALKRRDEQARRQALRDEIMRVVFEGLPQDLPCPTISNETPDGAWLNFSRSYGETWHSADVLEALERAGCVSLPITFTKYGNWRGSPKAGAQEDQPEENRNGKLENSEPLAPLWIVPEQHTGSHAITFYRFKGLVLRVSVPAGLGVYVTAKRDEYKGGWRYERGSARLRFPVRWHSIEGDDGAPVAMIASQSCAYVDTEQGISGAIYFTPIAHEQHEFPLSPSQFFRKLEG